MKKIAFACISICFFAISCKKSDNPSVGDTYMSLSAGNSWNYEFKDNITPANSSLYTITSTTRDTAVNAKTYHVFSNSNGANEYYNITGNDYFSFQSLPAALGGTKVDNLYLKDNAAVNSTWVQNFSITYSGVPVTVVVTNKIQEKGISKTVNGVAYTDVIHVITTLSVPGLPPGVLTLNTDIHYYYARKFGMIQNDSQIDFSFNGTSSNTNTQTLLKTATIL